MKHRHARVRALSGALTLMAALPLTGCGAADEVAAGVPATSRTAAFALAADGDAQRVAGHGISFLVPEDWTPHSAEKSSSDGESAEWGVEAPGAPGPFPAHVSVSAGIGDDAPDRFDDAPEAFLGVLSLNPGYRLLDEGAADVPGAEAAYSVRTDYTTTTEVDGERQEVSVSQVTVFLDMPGGQLTTVRFIAPGGTYDDTPLPDVRSSLVVAENTDGETS